MKLPGVDYRYPVQDLGRRSNDIHAATTQIIVDGSRKMLDAKLATISSKFKAESDVIKTAAQITVNEAGQEVNRVQHEGAKSVRRAQLATSLVNTVVNTAATLYNSYQKNEQQQQIANSSLSYSESMAEWTKSQSSVTEYDATQLPEGVYDGVTTITDALGKVVNAKVKRDEVYPELQFHQQKQAIQAASQNITDESRKKLFISNAMDDATVNYTKLAYHRLANQESQILKTTVATTNTLIDKGRYDDAQMYVSQSALPDDVKITKFREIEKASELSAIFNTANSVDTEKMIDVASKLESKDYGSVTRQQYNTLSDDEKATIKPHHLGTLDAEDRFRNATLLRNKVAQIESNRAGLNKSVVKQAVKDADVFVDMVYSGQSVNPNVIGNTIRAAQNMQNFPEETLAELKKVQTMLPAIQEFHNAPPFKREQMVEQLRVRAQNSGRAEDYTEFQRFDKMNDNFSRDMTQDPLKAVSSRGILPISKLDLTNPDSVLDRKTQVDFVQNKYGVKVPMLTKSEAEYYTSIINKEENSTKKMETIKVIYNVLGDKADNVLDSLGSEDISNRVLSMVDHRTGVEIIEGSKIRKENKSIAPNTKEFKEAFDNHFGTTFIKSAKLGSGFYDSVQDQYAFLAAKKGNHTGEIDDTIMKEVLEKFPVIELKSNSGWFDGNEKTHKFIPPADGVTTEMFMKDLRALPSQAYDGLFDDKTTPEQKIQTVAQKFANGEVYLQQRARNEFYMIDATTDNPIENVDGSLWKYEYGKKFNYTNTSQSNKFKDLTQGIKQGNIVQPAPLGDSISMTELSDVGVEYPEQEDVVMNKKPTRRNIKR